MKVLVLSAHPDDLELSCGGTISKMKSMGATIDNFILCPYQDHKKYLTTTSAILGFNPILNEEKERPKLDHNLIGKIENVKILEINQNTLFGKVISNFDRKNYAA